MNIEDKSQELIEKSEKNAGQIIRQAMIYQSLYEGFEHKFTEATSEAEQQEKLSFYEKFLCFTGRRGLVEARISERKAEKLRIAIRGATNQILRNLDSEKRVAISILDDMISMVKGLVLDYEYQRRYAIGSEVMEIVNLESSSRDVDAMLLTCREEIEFVEGLLKNRNPSIDYDIRDYRWAYLDIRDMPELLRKDVLERERIYNIWNKYIGVLQDAEMALSTGKEAKIKLDNYNFLESMCRRHQRLYEGERRVIHERFAMLELAIKSSGLQGLKKFYEEEIGTISLKQLKDETVRVEKELKDRFRGSLG